MCSNASCGCIVSQCPRWFAHVFETHVDETTVTLSEELVGSGNVHALVIGVEKSKAEINRALSVDVGGVSDREALVIAGGGLETGRIGVVGHHVLGSLLSEGLTSRIKVLDVADECGSGTNGLGDHSADRSGTSREENSSEDRLALAEVVGASLESDTGGNATVGGNSSAVDDSRAASDSGNDSGERRHVEKVTDFELKIGRLEVKWKVLMRREDGDEWMMLL